MENIKKVSQYEKILEAAYSCLSKGGYANVSLRQIAREADVALSQLHYYFGSKQELFKAIMKKMTTQFVTGIENHLKNTETPIERTSYVVKYFQKILTQNPELIRLLWDFTSLALWSDSFRELLDNLYKDLSDIIEEYILNSNLIKDGIKEHDSKLIARMILGSMLGIGVQILIDSEGEKFMDSLDIIKSIFK